MVDSCATCFFGRTAPADDPFVGSLLCGRNAPVFQKDAGPLWPVVQSDFWCGEFSDIDPHVYGIIGPPGPTGPTGPAGPAGSPGFNPVVINKLVANPVTFSSVGATMLGLGNAITPVNTGRLFVVINGFVGHSANGGAANWQIRADFGSAPPVGGTGFVGVQYGGTENAVFSSSTDVFPFSISAIVTGLALNTAAWADLAVYVSGVGGTATMTQVNTIAFEF